MVNTLLLLLFCELLGEGLTLVLPIPIPGPVLGMFLLLAALVIRGKSYAQLDDTATSLLSHLSLLFVPAGVGVMVHFQRIGGEWFALGLALILSTLVTMVVTAWTMQLMLRLQRGRVLVHD